MNRKKYMQIWYQQNKEAQKKKSLEYHYKNRNKALKRMGSYNNKNKKTLNKKAMEYYFKNKEDRDKKHKLWRLRNLDYDNQRSREYYYKHRDKMINDAVNYAKKNRDKINKRIRNKMKSDPAYRLKVILQSRTSAALTSYSSSTFEEFLGCSIQEARKHIELQFKKGMKWSNHGKWHIDHIRPISSFDLKKKDQIYECFNYKNLQPLWAKENLSKGAKYADKQASK